MSTLVIRLSSLGDVVLAGAVTGALHPVTFLTSRRYLEVAAALPGVTRVLAWEDGLPIRSKDHSQIIDLHASPRTRWLTRLCWPRRVARHDVQRRLRVAFKTAPAPSVIHRYAAATGGEPAPLPWMESDGPRDTLLLFPGAAHATKRWAPDRFAGIRRRWCETGGQVLVMGSASEASLCERVAGGEAEVLAEDGFKQTLTAMGRGAKAMGGDSGLTHLSAAAGIPTVVLLGPTTAQDGFWTHGGCAVSVPLSCRPCSRHGGSHCPVGDHACMEDLSEETAWDALSQVGNP